MRRWAPGLEGKSYEEAEAAQSRRGDPEAARGRRAVGGGTSPAEAAKALGVSEATFNRWRNQYGGMKGPEMKRLKELERENTRLKRLVAEQALDIAALKDVAEGHF